MSGLSRNAQVLRYLLDVAPGVGHTLLAKFAYLADLVARHYLGAPISEMQYRYDNHGPFDAVGFYRARDELLEAGLITHAPTEIGGYPGFEIHPTTRPAHYEFSGVQQEILRFVARQYASSLAICRSTLPHRYCHASYLARSASSGGSAPVSRAASPDFLAQSGHDPL